MKIPLICLVGRSGSGKNYICEAFNLNTIPSYTTRQKRKNETQGKEHIFVDIKDYNFFKSSENIAAETFFSGNYYWTTLDQINDMTYDTYIIDPDGIYELLTQKNFKFHRPLKIVYVKSRFFKRIHNMRKRGDSWKAILKRLINDKVFTSFEKNLKNINAKIIEV